MVVESADYEKALDGQKKLFCLYPDNIEMNERVVYLEHLVFMNTSSSGEVFKSDAMTSLSLVMPNSTILEYIESRNKSIQESQELDSNKYNYIGLLVNKDEKNSKEKAERAVMKDRRDALSNSLSSMPSYSKSFSAMQNTSTTCSTTTGSTTSGSSSSGMVHVRGYYRKDGTYVQSHYRRRPSR